MSHDEIYSEALRHCGVVDADLSSETRLSAITRIAQMYGAARIWERPGDIEDQLENARSKLSEAISAVESLDGFAKALARREATVEQDRQFESTLAAIADGPGSKEEKQRQLSEAVLANPPLESSQYVDNAAIEKMKALRKALERPITQAIPIAHTGPGRPKNLRAYLVAEHAYLLFEVLTQSRPTFWNGGETPFSRLVDFLFQAYGINSTIRKPIEAAMHKFGNSE